MTTPYYDNRQQQSGGQSFNTFGQEFDGQQSFNNYGYGGDQQDAHQRVGYPYLPSSDPNAASSTNSPFPPQNNQQFMYDPLFNTARHLGGQFAEQQRQKFAQYISTFNLKYYFAVDTTYVRRKLCIILFPFLHRDWTNKLSHEKPMTPQEDVNAPDLYIPVMAFITYILVAGFVFGVQKRFTPEKLGMLTTNALFYMVLENLIVFVMKYALNISQSLNIWHALSYSSYKFTGMVVCLLLYLIGGKKVYYFALVYFILSTVFFLLRSLKTFILDMGWSPESGRKRKVYLLLSITAFQSLIMWLLTNSVTNYMPANYDFAKLAMSGMGLAATNGNNGVPLTADGDVDYEALLKMP